MMISSFSMINGDIAVSNTEDGRLSLSARGNIYYYPLVLDFKCDMFSQAVEQTCGTCQDVSRKVFSICDSPTCHTQEARCEPCLIDLFKKTVQNFAMINRLMLNPTASSPTDLRYRVYMDGENLLLCSCKSYPFEGNFLAWFADGNEPEGPGKVRVEFLDYQVGTTSQFRFPHFEQNSEQKVYGVLPNGTIVVFPDVQMEVAEKVAQEGLSVFARIISRSIVNSMLTLECSFLPKKITPSSFLVYRMHSDMKIRVRYGIPLFSDPEKKEGICSSCSEKKAELYSESSQCKLRKCKPCCEMSIKNVINEFALVGPISTITSVDKEGTEIGVRYRCYAEQEKLLACPCGCGLQYKPSISILNKKQEWIDAEISWLDYRPGKTVQVGIERFDSQTRQAIGRLENGMVIIKFLSIAPDFDHKLQELIESKREIQAEVSEKFLGKDGKLYLICFSKEISQRSRYTLSCKAPFSINDYKVELQYRPTLVSKHLSQEEEYEPCGICLETPKIAYYVCPQHTGCKSCLLDFFSSKLKDIKALSQGCKVIKDAENKIISCQMSILQDMLPSCPMCRVAIASEEQFSILVGNTPATVTILDYQVGQQIQVKISQALSSKDVARGKMEDGSIVWIPNIQQDSMQNVIENQTLIHAEIISKSVSSDRVLYLKCRSTDLSECIS